MYSYLIALGLVTSCGSQKNRSERDLNREQKRSQSRSKEEELKTVAGTYKGFIHVSEEYKLKTSLKLDIQNIVSRSEGEIDPVLIPQLVGSLKLSSRKITEEEKYDTVIFSSKDTDFDPKLDRLSLQFFNEVYGNLEVSLLLKENSAGRLILAGEWNIPKHSLSGSMTLIPNNIEEANEQENESEDYKISGTYLGKLKNIHPKANLPKRISLSILMNRVVTNSSSYELSGNIRFIIGSEGRYEYFQYNLLDMDFNIFNGLFEASVDSEETLNAQSEEKGSFSIIGSIINGKLSGSLYFGGLGKVAEIEANYTL